MKPTDASKNLRKIAAAIDASTSPDRGLVARDLRTVLASVEGTAAPVAGAAPGHPGKEFDPNEYYSPGESVESFFSWLGDESVTGGLEASGSQLLWHAMKHFGIKDWGPAVDAEGIIAKAVELSKAKGDDAQQTKYVEEYARGNWDSFMESIWPKIQAGEEP